MQVAVEKNTPTTSDHDDRLNQLEVERDDQLSNFETSQSNENSSSCCIFFAWGISTRVRSPLVGSSFCEHDHHDASSSPAEVTMAASTAETKASKNISNETYCQ